MFSCLNIHAQSYTKYYDPLANLVFDHAENYVVQEFVPSSQFPFNGTITIQSLHDPINSNRTIQVTLVDQDGNFQKGFTFYSTIPNSKFIPTCAAYDYILKEYVFAGVFEDFTNTVAPYSSWFLSVDENLDEFNSFPIYVNETGVGGSANNFFVTDIAACPVASANLNGNFVFVGVTSEYNDPSPTTNLTLHQTMLVGYYHGAGNINGQPSLGAVQKRVDYSATLPGSSWAINNTLFPSRIIEISLPIPNGGFMITGDGPVTVNTIPTTYNVGSLFFMRMDFDLNTSILSPPLEVKCFNDNSPNLDFGGLHGGDLYFDPVQEEIWFAGTHWGGNLVNNGFIYQKIINLNNPGITFATVAGSTTSFGSFRLPGNMLGFPKVAKIMPADNPNVATIASNLFEDNYYNVGSTPYSLSYPMLKQVNYSNTNLNNFNILPFQSPTFYTYTRQYGNLGISNYLPFLLFNNLFSPSHTAHTFPVNAFPNNSYVLGSTTYDPNNAGGAELLTLNRTENYWENDCRVDDVTDVPLFMIANLLPSLPITNGNVGAMTTYSSPIPGFVLNPITSISNNDCVTGNSFKPIAKQTTTSYISIRNSSLLINNALNASSFTLYSMQGAIVSKGNLHKGNAIQDIGHLADAMYLVELKDYNNNSLSVEKIIK